ncbi:MAG: TonB-dependent receptor [Flavobacteriaceae bacterium]|nr:TonB-dependent receptor [Flavobacteriaceae bacterium]
MKRIDLDSFQKISRISTIVHYHPKNFVINYGPDSNLKQVFQNQSLGDYLGMLTPSYLKSYGNGMLGSVSIRGGNASQTAMIWNGFTLNGLTHGVSDLNLFQMSQFARISVSTSGSGALDGGGAMNGSINLWSTPILSESLKKQFSLQFGAGSFGTNDYSFSSGKSSKKWAWTVGILRKRSENNFWYNNTSQVGSPRERNPFSETWQNQGNAALTYQLNNRNKLETFGWVGAYERKLQQGMGTSPLKQTQKDNFLRTGLVWTRIKQMQTTTARLGYFYDETNYSSNNLLGNAKAGQWQAGVNHEQLKVNEHKVDRINIGAELQVLNANTDNYPKEINEWRPSVYANWSRSIHNWKWTVAIRQGWLGSKALIPSILLGKRFNFKTKNNQFLAWKSSLSSNYRYATLNERFWIPGGNSSIRFEQNYMAETGLEGKLTKGKWKMEGLAVVYWSVNPKMIQWQPTDFGFWAVNNTQNVSGQGLELNGNANFTRKKIKLTIGGFFNYCISQGTVNDTSLILLKRLNQRIYVPFNTASAFTNLQYKRWVLSLMYRYTGFRFTSTDNSEWLQPLSLLGLNLNYKLLIKNQELIFSARADNLMNKNYQTVKNFAMPGRSFYFSLQLNLNDK